jgi:hypothetical protein
MKTVSEYTTEKKYRILGFNDDQCSCDVCGKQELKGTYAMENLSTGEIFRAGSSCGAKMAGWTSKELVAKYKAGEKEILENAKKELRNSAEYIAYNNGLDFLNKESDDIQRKLSTHPNEADRKIIAATERTFESRMEYIQPLSKALDNKRIELVAKHNLPKGMYLN